MSGKRVLVTGGAGFIGSHVCDAYLVDGWDVTVVDDLSSGKRENVPVGAELIEIDIRSDDLTALFRDRRFRVVNHHAAQIDVRVSVERPRHDASINIDGLLNLTENARAHGVERFVYVSSGGVVYGEPDALPVAERAPKLPRSPYGVSKLAGEQYLYYYRVIHGLTCVALRYSNVYGPRQDPHGEAGVVAIFSERLVRGEPITIFGDGEQTRDYVYVGDVARANLLVSGLRLTESSDIDDVAFNVGTAKQTSVNQLARTMMEVAGREVEIQYAPRRPGELQRSALDASRLHAIGWEPRHSLHEGLEATYRAIAEVTG